MRPPAPTDELVPVNCVSKEFVLSFCMEMYWKRAFGHVRNHNFSCCLSIFSLTSFRDSVIQDNPSHYFLEAHPRR